MLLTTHESQISPRFALRLPISKILGNFSFSHWPQCKISIFLKKNNSKFNSFAGTVARNIQKKVGWKRFVTVGVVAFPNLHSHRVHLCIFRPRFHQINFLLSIFKITRGHDWPLWRWPACCSTKLMARDRDIFYYLIYLLKRGSTVWVAYANITVQNHNSNGIALISVSHISK